MGEGDRGVISKPFESGSGLDQACLEALQRVSRASERLKSADRSGDIEKLVLEIGPLKKVLKWVTNWSNITRYSFCNGIIPRQCPICKVRLGKPGDLHLHHWMGKFPDVFHAGFYRRLCGSCNTSLGGIYKGIYPPMWEEQFSKLSKYIRLHGSGMYPHFDGIEGSWSLVTLEERQKLEILTKGIWWSQVGRLEVDIGWLDKEIRRLEEDLERLCERKRGLDGPYPGFTGDEVEIYERLRGGVV